MYKPQFTITNKLLRNIANIEASREVINHAPLLPYYEKQFREDALIRTVHYGTHLEGNELNLNQAEKVIQGEKVVARERDIQEVINYRNVIRFIGEWAEEKKQIDEVLMKHLHKLTLSKILPAEKCGFYRSTQVVIKNSISGEVSFKPPPPQEITQQIADFFAFISGSLSKDIHPVIKSGIVHYEFVRIHPFVDGNGRVGRALSTLMLFIDAYDIRKFFSLEEYFDKHAIDYYAALKSVEKNNGDLTDWLTFFSEVLAIELTKIKEKVERISVDAKIKQKLGGKPILLSERQLKIIEYIQEVGFLQNKSFATLFPLVSEDTILNDIKALLSAGIIKKQGVTKGARYIMT